MGGDAQVICSAAVSIYCSKNVGTSGMLTYKHHLEQGKGLSATIMQDEREIYEEYHPV